ncbi:MAG: sn-glycerol-3-phosphate ABC transporter ATP-binding protein UgpC [Rhodoferax sp.]|nr:sn-glycerol-3-phosphate ABC transporter ATP-binding protein UgpC [Rhodoferax sp.]
MSFLEISQLKKRFGSLQTLHGIDLQIEEGEFVVFVGPSGCGKSTLLRIIAGLEDVTEGSIRLNGRDVTHSAPSTRSLAMVFQSYALYPHMTVEQNLSFGMRMRGESRATIQTKLARAIQILQLEPYLQRKPGELSGGQCQRVAIGRAIVQEPAIFLFDEPLSNLDAELRLRMRVEISALHKELGKTMVYVTHDQVEAMTLADRIVVLRAGKIEQVGNPMQLYTNPDNAFVAGFIGSPATNFLQAELELVDPSGRATVLLEGNIRWTCALREGHGVALGQTLTVGVRPEHWELQADGQGASGTALSVRLHLVERLGASTHAYGRIGPHEVCICADPQRALAVGDTVWVTPRAQKLYAFDAQGRCVSARHA